MQLTDAQAARARDAVADLDWSPYNEETPALETIVQTVADALWPGFIGQPRRPLPTGYRPGVIEVPAEADAPAAWTWAVLTADGTAVGMGRPCSSREGAELVGRLVLGLDDVA